jgi:translation initiation factor IF-2
MVDRIKVKDLAQAMGKTIPEIIFILNSLGIQKSSEDDELTQEEAKMLISGQVPTVQKPIIIREDSDKKEKQKKKTLKPPVPTAKIVAKESKIIEIPKKKVEKVKEEKVKEKEEKILPKKEKEIAPKKEKEVASKKEKEAGKKKEKIEVKKEIKKVIEEKREIKVIPKKEKAAHPVPVEEVPKEKVIKKEEEKAKEKRIKEIPPEPKKYEKKERIKKEAQPLKYKIKEEEEEEIVDLKLLKGKSVKAIEEIQKEKEEKEERLKLRKIKKPAEEEAKPAPLSLKDQVEKLKSMIPKEAEILLPEASTLKDLTEKLNIKVKDIMPFFMEKGWNISINQPLTKNVAEKIAEELNFKVKFISYEESLETQEKMKTKGKGTPKPPVVTIMGHVDHGKTTLIDYIKKTKITASEEGGITQKIGVYEITHNGKKIVFIDTPGHEAFGYMRAKGAQATDIIILVVAADDGVMPQTIEAIGLAKQAKVPIIVAINKIDKGNADVERTIQQLGQRGLLRDTLGGDTVMVPISALKGTGVNELLDMILLVAEINELKADLSAPAKGVILESKKESGRGIVATVILQEGVLKKGDYFLCGNTYGKVKSIVDDRGRILNSVSAGSGFELVGFEDLPEPGDILTYVKNEDEAKKIVELRRETQKIEKLKPKVYSVEGMLQFKDEGKKVLPLILKAESHGVLEVLRDTAKKAETEKVEINIIGEGVGSISYNDAMLASTSKAIIIGFGVKIDSMAAPLIKAENIRVIIKNVIFHLEEEIQELVKSMIEPQWIEQTIGKAEVLKIFKIPNVGTIAGCKITNGYVKRGALVRVIRGGEILFSSRISSLKYQKEDRTEIREGFECGIGLEKSTELKEGDTIEVYEKVKVG